LGLSAVKQLGASRVFAMDSDILGLLSTMINFTRAGARESLTPVYGCLKQDSTYRLISGDMPVDYVIFNGPLPVDRVPTERVDYIMYDPRGIIRDAFASNLGSLMSETGRAQIMSDKGFEEVSPRFGLRSRLLRSEPEGPHFYLVKKA